MSSRSSWRWFVVALALFLALPSLVTRGSAQDATPTGGDGTPATDYTESGPVFAADRWRVSISGAVRAPALNSIGLKRSDDKEWVVVVADVTNLSAETAELATGDFTVTSDGEKAGGFTRRAASGVAQKLAVEPSNPDEEPQVEAGASVRVVWTYKVAVEVDELAFALDD